MTRVPPLSPNAWLRWDVISGELPSGAATLLEIGCGRGGVGARLAQRYQYVGVEPDLTSCRAAQEVFKTLGIAGEVRHGGISAVHPDERFDVVVAFEVIEHIEDDAAAIRSWLAHLRPGGTLILTAPAWQRRYGAADEWVGHHRRYDPADMRDLLAGAGMGGIEIRLFGAPLGYVLETARNLIARRRIDHSASPEDRSATSGRRLQPRNVWVGRLTATATVPFRVTQRFFPQRGPGLFARALKPGA